VVTSGGGVDCDTVMDCAFTLGSNSKLIVFQFVLSFQGHEAGEAIVALRKREGYLAITCVVCDMHL
jgi:hypothetical protein